MELILLTELDGDDYAHAALAAAARRGRGYAASGLMLLVAAVVAGRVGFDQMLVVLAAAGVLWCLYYAVGFWTFARGVQANGFGSFLTLGLPLTAFLLHRLAGPAWLSLVPPGVVFAGLTQPISWPVLTGLFVYGLLALLLVHYTRRHADGWLRRWYDLNHGRRSAE